MTTSPLPHFKSYAVRLTQAFEALDWAPVEQLARELQACFGTRRQVFFCGNGGSAGNANHIANDFLYPVSKTKGSGLRIHSLSENPAVLTCLANDEGYENIYAHQLAVMANRDDILIVLSGSGNSPNILKALEEAKKLGMKSYAILGFSGGKAKQLADVPIHFTCEDMQVCEDTQTIICHMIVQWLYAQNAGRDSASDAA